MGALLDFKLARDWALAYVCYTDENKIIFVWTILSTTMTTTDAGLTQVEFRNCTHAWWCKITHTVVSWARKWDFDAYRICPKAACKRPCGVSSGNIGLIIIWVFIYIHTLCMRAVKAMARMRICAGTPEPSLLGYMISIQISWACPIIWHLCLVSQCKSARETH